ncbi:hypothetical protein EU803_10030 [Loktanella sp. IMCC34160]|nr:hypothetical protein EU803_10030 [Loktanella sp. IMCC34160]
MKSAGVGVLLRGTCLGSLIAMGLVGTQAAVAADLIWDPGNTDASADINPGDGNWDIGTTAVWNDGSTGGLTFSSGDNVTFEEEAMPNPDIATVTITEDVDPGQITFLADTTAPFHTVDFIIAGGGGEILSASGTFAPGVLQIVMGDAAEISAGLNGDFLITGSEQLTLSGASPNLNQLTVNADANVFVSTTGDLAGSISSDGTFASEGNIGTLDVWNGSATLEGTATYVNIHTGATVDISANNSAGLDVGTFILGSTVDLTLSDTTGTLTADTFTNNGDVTIEDGGTLTMDGGNPFNNLNGTLDVQAGGVLDGDVEHNSTSMTVHGTVTGDVVANSNGLVIEGDDPGEDNAGVIQGTLTVANGATAEAEDGVEIGSISIETGGNLSLTESGTVTVTDAGVTSVTIANGGTLEHATNGSGTLALAPDATMDVAGTIFDDDTGPGNSGDIFTIEAGTVNLLGTAVLDGDIRLDADVNSNIAITASGYGFDLDGDWTNLAGGSFTVDQALDTNGNALINNADDALITINSNIALTGDVTNTNGTVNMLSNSEVTGEVNNSDALNITTATVGSIVNTATGTVEVTSGGWVDTTIDNAGIFNLNSGTLTVDGLTTNQNGGTLTIDSGAFFAGDVTNEAGGTLDVDGQINGAAQPFTVNNSGTMTLAGTVVGALTNSDTVDGTYGLTVDGAANITGTLTNSGEALVSSTLQVTGGVTNESGGVLTLNSTLTGNVTNESGGEVNTDGTGQITGSLESAGVVEVEAGEQLTVTVNPLTIQNGGELLLGGTIGNPIGLINTNVDIEEGGVLNTTSNSALIYGTLALDGTATIEDTERLDVTGLTTIEDGGIMNLAGFFNGTMTIDSGGVLNFSGGGAGAAVTNGGTINVDGTGLLNGGLNGSGTIDMQDGATDDVLTISNGTANLNGATINLDLNLSGTPGSDQIVFTTISPTGTVDLNFSLTTADTAPIAGGLVVIDASAADASLAGITFTTDDLAAIPSANVYYLAQNDSIVAVRSSGNPNIGGLAGAVVLTQSLIGSVVNRPSSPFVAGLALPGDDPCGAGAWGRATGGIAEVGGTTTVTNDDGTLTVDSNLTAEFGGIQLGGDFSCFGGYYNGWDLSFGGILGVNFGSTAQPLYAIDSLGNADTTLVLSNNNTDFLQTYAGAYVSAFKGRSLLDLQYRFEQTTFDLTNDRAGDPESAGILNQEFDSKAQTLSGSYSYVFPINQDLGINAVPTAGFAYSQTTTNTIDLSDDRTLEIEDFDSQIGFVGGTISMTQIRPSGNSAFTYFGTATYYKDFAGEITSVIYDGSNTETDVISSPNLGQYGELSLGVNYTQILDGTGSLPNARQLNASVRVDGRFSESLESWGVTGQLRLQF